MDTNLISCNVFLAMPEKPKLLTVRLDPKTYIEFAAATVVLRHRNVSSLLHQFVVQKIREAQETVSPEEFQNVFVIQ